MFLIQIRQENKNNLRVFEDIINSNGGGEPKDWSNYEHQFEDIEKAQRECQSLISSGQYKANNVRIVEVVCTFESKISVQSNKVRRKEG